MRSVSDIPVNAADTFMAKVSCLVWTGSVATDDCVGHVGCVTHFANIVHPQDIRTITDSQGYGGSRSPGPLSRFPAEYFADERFAGRADHQREGEAGKFPQTPKDFQVVTGFLAETDTGVDRDPFPLDPGLERPVKGLLQ
jgi:hypothetical protein